MYRCFESVSARLMAVVGGRPFVSFFSSQWVGTNIRSWRLISGMIDLTAEVFSLCSIEQFVRYTIFVPIDPVTSFTITSEGSLPTSTSWETAKSCAESLRKLDTRSNDMSTVHYLGMTNGIDDRIQALMLGEIIWRSGCRPKTTWARSKN